MSDGFSGGMLQAGAALVDIKTGRLTKTGRRFLDMLFQRTGGGYDGIFDTNAGIADAIAMLEGLLADQELSTALLSELSGLTVAQDLNELRSQVEELLSELTTRNDLGNGDLNELRDEVAILRAELTTRDDSSGQLAETMLALQERVDAIQPLLENLDSEAIRNQVEDDDVGYRRGLVVRGTGPPPAARSAVYTDIVPVPNVGWLAGGGQRRRINKEQQMGTCTTINILDTAGAFFAVARAKFEAVDETDFIRIFATDEMVATLSNAANTGTWAIYFQDTDIALNTDITGSGTYKNIWLGGTNGLTNSSDDLAQSIYYAASPAESFVRTSFGTNFGGADLFVFLCLDVSAGGGETISFSSADNFTVLLS